MTALKILTFIGIIAAGLFFLRRASGSNNASDPQTAPASGRGGAEDLALCPHCGGYRPSSQICECQRAPTP